MKIDLLILGLNLTTLAACFVMFYLTKKTSIQVLDGLTKLLVKLPKKNDEAK